MRERAPLQRERDADTDRQNSRQVSTTRQTDSDMRFSSMRVPSRDFHSDLEYEMSSSQREITSRERADHCALTDRAASDQEAQSSAARFGHDTTVQGWLV